VFQILLEAFKTGKNTLVLGDFIKGDYWKIEEFSSELFDTGDFANPQDWVLEQIISTIENLRLGTITSINITSLDRLFRAVIEDIMGSEPEKGQKDDFIGYYKSTIDDIYKLRELSKQQMIERGDKDNWREYDDKVVLARDSYHRHIERLIFIGASLIEIEVKFSNKGMLRMEEAMRDYLKIFSLDTLVNNTPNYREKRYYYSKQLENFVMYINKLPEIEGAVNVPFDALSEDGFEFVKIVSILEQKAKLRVSKWNDEHMWNVRFWESPITIHSLTSAKKEETAQKEVKLQLDWSFSEELGMLKLGTEEVKFRPYTEMYHMMRIIFEDSSETAKMWQYSEIAERIDQEKEVEDKKMENTAYRANQKIAVQTNIKDFFKITKQSVCINPKYT
jgi:hypothetical protein